MHMMPEEEAYLCPVRAMADWIEASEITSGYVFRRMASRDRASKRNSPMVMSIPKIALNDRLMFLFSLHRHHNRLWKYFATTSLISASTQPHMELTPFAEAAVNIWHRIGAGACAESVNGADGARNFQMQPS